MTPIKNPRSSGGSEYLPKNSQGHIAPNGGQTQAACSRCAFYRQVELATALRRVCMLTGDKRPAAGVNGCVFRRGRWNEETALPEYLDGNSQCRANADFPLTGLDYRGNLAFPNRDRLSDSLARAPHGQNDGHFILSHFPCRNWHVEQFGGATSSTREGWRLISSRGTLRRHLFLNPE